MSKLLCWDCTCLNIIIFIIIRAKGCLNRFSSLFLKDIQGENNVNSSNVGTIILAEYPMYKKTRRQTKYEHLSDRIKQHVPKHLVEPTQEGKKRGRGRPPKNLTKPAAERYQSAIACHLAGNERCLQAFSCDQFSVLSRARSARQLHVLEAIFIQRLKPSLCRQKSFVTKLYLVSTTVC